MFRLFVRSFFRLPDKEKKPPRGKDVDIEPRGCYRSPGNIYIYIYILPYPSDPVDVHLRVYYGPEPRLLLAISTDVVTREPCRGHETTSCVLYPISRLIEYNTTEENERNARARRRRRRIVSAVVSRHVI